MAVDTPSDFIDDMNADFPTGAEPKNEGDDHIRNIKKAVKGSFPNIGGTQVNATATRLNELTDSTVTTAELNNLTGLAENVQDGLDAVVNSFTVTGDNTSGTDTPITITDGDDILISGLGTAVTTSTFDGTGGIYTAVRSASYVEDGVVQLSASVGDTSDTTAPSSKTLNDLNQFNLGILAQVVLTGSASNRKFTIGAPNSPQIQVITGTYTHTLGHGSTEEVTFADGGFDTQTLVVIADLAQEPGEDGLGINASNWNATGFTSRRHRYDNTTSGAPMNCAFIAIGF